MIYVFRKLKVLPFRGKKLTLHIDFARFQGMEDT